MAYGVKNNREPQTIKANFEAVKAIVSVDRVAERETLLRQSGERLVGKCPLPDHDDRTPSFTIFPDDRGFYSRWKCFGCGEGGDVIDLHARMEELNHNMVWAMEDLADREGVRLWRDATLRPGSPILAARKARQRVWNAYMDAICRTYFEAEIMPEIEAIEDPSTRQQVLHDCLRAAKLHESPARKAS